MDATGRRFGSLLEWLCAACCVAGGALLLSVAVHNFRHMPAVVPVIAKEALEPAPIHGIPAGVARVPLLLLPSNRQVHVGDRISEVTRRLGSAAQLTAATREEVGTRIRATHFYTDIGTQFVLVFDTASRDQELRVAAIFVR